MFHDFAMVEFCLDAVFRGLMRKLRKQYFLFRTGNLVVNCLEMRKTGNRSILRELGCLGIIVLDDRVQEKLLLVEFDTTDSIQQSLFESFFLIKPHTALTGKNRWHPIFDSRNSFHA